MHGPAHLPAELQSKRLERLTYTSLQLSQLFSTRVAKYSKFVCRRVTHSDRTAVP